MATTAFNSQLVSAKLNLAFRRALVTGSIVNRDWAGEITKPGDTVSIVRPIGTTIRAYSSDTDIEYDEVDGSPTSLVADQADYFSFLVHDVDNASAYVNSCLSQDMYGMLAKTDAYVLGHYDDAASANKVEVDVSAGDAEAAAALVSAIRQARARLTKQDVPETGR